MSRRFEVLGVFVLCLVVVSSLVGCVGPRDYFVTTLDGRGGGSFRNVTIPAGFFCPDCEGFSGRVELVGSPLNRAKTGAADSILVRSGDPIRPWDGVGKTRTVRLKLVELSLMSKAPITVMSKKGPQQWDIHVGLSDKRPPTGKLTATKTHANGGTFDSTFYVQELLTFTNVENPKRILVLDTADNSEPLELTAKGTPFVIERNPEMRLVSTKGSNFAPAVVQKDPQIAATQQLIDIRHLAEIAAHIAILVPLPEIPEPGPIGPIR